MKTHDKTRNWTPKPSYSHDGAPNWGKGIAVLPESYFHSGSYCLDPRLDRETFLSQEGTPLSAYIEHPMEYNE
jgi:hypothetical protein